MFGDLRSGPSVTGMIFCEVYCMIRRPVLVSPVNAIFEIACSRPGTCRLRGRSR